MNPSPRFLRSRVGLTLGLLALLVPSRLPAQSVPAVTPPLAAQAPAAGRAAETLDEKSLPRWQSAAGTPAADTKTGTVTLPAGSQLYRRVAEESLNLRLVSRPVFGAQPVDWASIELGPVSLTFVRDPDGGGMVLLADEPLGYVFKVT